MVQHNVVNTEVSNVVLLIEDKVIVGIVSTNMSTSVIQEQFSYIQQYIFTIPLLHLLKKQYNPIFIVSIQHKQRQVLMLLLLH